MIEPLLLLVAVVLGVQLSNIADGLIIRWLNCRNPPPTLPTYTPTCCCPHCPQCSEVRIREPDT